MHFVVYTNCQGEFGSLVVFYDRKEKKGYALTGMCPNGIIKDKGKYILTTTLSHGFERSHLKIIKDPTKLVPVPDSIYQVTADWQSYEHDQRYIDRQSQLLKNEIKTIKEEKKKEKTIHTKALFPIEGNLHAIKKEKQNAFRNIANYSLTDKKDQTKLIFPKGFFNKILFTSFNTETTLLQQEKSFIFFKDKQLTKIKIINQSSTTKKLLTFQLYHSDNIFQAKSNWRKKNNGSRTLPSNQSEWELVYKGDDKSILRCTGGLNSEGITYTKDQKLSRLVFKTGRDSVIMIIKDYSRLILFFRRDKYGIIKIKDLDSFVDFYDENNYQK